MDVNGKVAVVTGAASGIGRAMATRFVAAGMKVAMADIEKGPLDQTVSALESAGGAVIGVPTDVSDPSSVESLRDTAVSELGPVHVLCNNAGVGAGGLTWEQPVEDWEWVLGVNLWGVVHGIRAFVPAMVAQGSGHVVNTASMAGLTSPAFMSIYNVSKHSVVAISETMFAELDLLGSDVGVSVLCPGWVNTRIHEADRNRPGADQESGDMSAEEAGRAEMFRSTLGNLIATGIDPAQVADQVLDAIQTKRFYILTHPEWKPMISSRVDSIVNETDPPKAALPTV